MSFFAATKGVSDYRMNVLTSTVDYDDSRFHTEFRELYRTLARKNDKIGSEDSRQHRIEIYAIMIFG